jgi:hypothetical protein
MFEAEHELIVTSDGRVTENSITGMYTMWNESYTAPMFTTPFIYLAKGAYKAHNEFWEWGDE